MRTVTEGCAIATVDAVGNEYRDGQLVSEGDRIVAVGEGSALTVVGATHAVELLLVGGREIVEGGELRTAGEAQLAAEIARASRRLAARAEARV